MGGQILVNVVTTVGMLLLAIAVHEWAHVAMARFLGDRTGEALGRYTLNPLAHADPIWTIALPAYFVVMQTISGGVGVPFFGAGKPAPYTPIRLTRQFGGQRIRMSTAEMLVALAGPVSNLVMAAIATVVVAGLVRTGEPLFGDPRSFALLGFKFALLNTGLFFFNLIPVPPLDGSKVLFHLLPRDLALKYESISGQLSWVLLLAAVFGARVVLAPLQGAAAELIVSVVQALN